MANKHTDGKGRFPGVEPIPEPDRPDHASTDMLDDFVTGVLENKDEEEIRKDYRENSKPAPYPDDREA